MAIRTMSMGAIVIGHMPGGSRGFGIELLDEPNFLGTKEIGRG